MQSPTESVLYPIDSESFRQFLVGVHRAVKNHPLDWPSVRQLYIQYMKANPDLPRLAEPQPCAVNSPEEKQSQSAFSAESTTKTP